METQKYIIDVQPENGKALTREQAVKVAVRTASAKAKEDGLVGTIRPHASRLKTEENLKVWQVLAEVLEKKADFPPKDDEAPSDDAPSDDKPSKSDESDKGDLPSKIQDVIDNHEDSLPDELASALQDIVSQLQAVLDGAGVEDKGDKEGDEDPMDDDMGDDIDAPTPPMDGPPPVEIGGPKKPPFMAKKVLQVPKQIIEGDDIKTASIKNVTRKQALAEARTLPRELPSLRGYRLAKLDETATHFVAEFTR